MTRELKCPSCGADLKFKEGQKTVVCKYCESTVIVPDELRKQTGSTGTAGHTVSTGRTSQSGAKRRVMISVITAAVIVLITTGVLVFNLSRVHQARDAATQAVSAAQRQAGSASGSTGSQQGEGVQVLQEFGGEGTGRGRFVDAGAVAVDGLGRIYVSDDDNGRIQLFDSDGSYVTQWTVQGERGDSHARSMSGTPDGRLVVSYDSELYMHDGRSGEVLMQLDHPDGWGFDDVDVGDDGTIAASWYKNRDDLVLFDSDGTLRTVVPEAISGRTGDSELNMRVAVDGLGNVYVLGTFTETVFKYSPQGEFLNRFGSGGDERGQFQAASDVAVDASGMVFVKDFGGLKVFDAEGRFLGNVEISYPVFSMAFDGDQLLLVTSEQMVRKLQLPPPR
ncbi:hypothetical protein GF402_04170 [Candidatus Fermentibacteria bacterium]|nr:hypothetical protein [Candidatus Fermentibacteria bacterium]